MKVVWKGCSVPKRSTLAEAAVELGKLTGKPWAPSDVLEIASQKLIQLDAIVSIDGPEDFEPGVPLEEPEKDLPADESDADVVYDDATWNAIGWDNTPRRRRDAEIWSDSGGCWTFATVPAIALRELLLGRTTYVEVRHPFDGPRRWPVRYVTVTRDQIRLSAEMLESIHNAVETELIEITPKPSGAQDAADSPALTPGPEPLTTGDIAFCFAGLRWKTEVAWKKPLGDKPKWLSACISIPGERGVREARWNPVCIAAALVRGAYVKPNTVRARFQTMKQLKPWLEEWKTYEADYFDTD